MTIQEVLIKRRKAVLNLMLQRWSVEKMAKQFDVSISTIDNDIRKVRSEYRHRELSQEDKDPVIDFLLRNEEQYRMAKLVYDDAVKADFSSMEDERAMATAMSNAEKIKLQAIDQMAKLDDTRIKTMQSIGILQKNLGRLDVREVKFTVSWEGGRGEGQDTLSTS